MEVREEIISIGLRDIAAVQVERKEHDSCPNHDLDVYLADNGLEEG